MKKRLVQTLQSGDNFFGQVSHPDDLMKAEDFLHDRVNEVVHDFVNSHENNTTSGFTYELGAGSDFNIEIKRPGRVYTQDGLSFELLADTTLEFDAADEEFPRLDLVVAVLDDEIPAELDLIPFVQLRTADEFSDSVPPYPPSNIEAPRELHWRAVPQIKKGNVGSPSPTLPAVASNEIPLYVVAVAAGATQLRDADVTDVRQLIQTLRKINELVAKGQIDVSTLTQRVTRLEIIKNMPIDLSQVFGEIKTLGQILAELQRQIVASRDLPEIRYKRLKGSLTIADPDSAKIIAVGNTDAGTPCVDIDVGGLVNFGDSEVAIVPQRFADQTVNPRFVKIGADPGNVKRSVDITLDDVTQVAGDGFIDFLQRSSEFGTLRGRPGAAARDDQFIEIFGGLASDNQSKLGDWLTYDVINDTLTLRAPLTALPSADRPAMFPYGDGEHVLLITATETNPTPKCWKINADTSAVTEIVTTKPTGVSFFGDLISDGKIFVVAIRKVLGGFETDYWEFDTGTDTFTQLGVTGSVPDPDIDCAHGCFYEDGKFIMVTFAKGLTGSGRTFIFDRTSLQWTEKQNITQPFGGASDKQSPLTRFRLANINGRPLLVGGLLTKDSDSTNSKVWELKKGLSLGWNSWDATFTPLQDSGFCSTIGSDGLPSGKAFLFAGHGKYSDARGDIYSSVQGGLIAVNYGGLPGVSIASTASFAQFEIDPFTADWAVAAYMGILKGRYDKSTMKAEVSMDDGDHWQEITSDAHSLVIADSDDPAVRRVRITLYKNDAKPPIVTRLDEVLDEDGTELEDLLIVRYNSSVDDTKALYIDRNGVITLSTVIEPSTPEKALIHTAAPAGPATEPDLRNYINRRRAHFKFSGQKTAGLTPPQYHNEMAVPVKYVHAWGVKDADAAMYHLVDPIIEFDEAVLTDVDDVMAVDDLWFVEVEV